MAHIHFDYLTFLCERAAENHHANQNQRRTSEMERATASICSSIVGRTTSSCDKIYSK